MFVHVCKTKTSFHQEWNLKIVYNHTSVTLFIAQNSKIIWNTFRHAGHNPFSSVRILCQQNRHIWKQNNPIHKHTTFFKLLALSFTESQNKGKRIEIVLVEQSAHFANVIYFYAVSRNLLDGDSQKLKLDYAWRCINFKI